MKVILKEIKKNTTNSLFKWDWRTFIHMKEGEKSGKSMSQTWFEKAAESESLDKDKKELSKRFASIAAYYASLDSVDESGYSTTSYGDYWIDLVSLTDGDLTSVVNPETAS